MDSRLHAADNRRPPGNREGAVKLGYFHNGHFPPIEFEEFVRWGAANGYQAIDVPLFEPNVRAICDRHGLEPTSTVGMACQPIATDPGQRAQEAAQARRALDYAAAEHIPNVWLGHEMAPDLGFDENVSLFARGRCPGPRSCRPRRRSPGHGELGQRRPKPRLRTGPLGRHF